MEINKIRDKTTAIKFSLAVEGSEAIADPVKCQRKPGGKYRINNLLQSTTYTKEDIFLPAPFPGYL